ncbi:type I-MYXAN CRISPR-associated protein Cas6/Cmx6 [Thioalkalicoccus limnaeus]|uniref:Type I-MYXAN CRISPR-associated protein Cas6/Cmx6 n=1 Tax=Thioalkalicoccus limnaeus TaxID=120681 RepID=A0ABV4BF35_9GAMM
MLWQEETSDPQRPIADEVVDIQFSLSGRQIPVDHVYALSQAISRCWHRSQERVPLGVHSIHVAGSQNGWQRPSHATDQYLMLSRRTRLMIRVAQVHVPAVAEALTGCTLDVAGCPLTVGAGKIRPLSREKTLFARHILDPFGEDEGRFLEWAVAELRSMPLRVRKALCGKPTQLATADGPRLTRSLLLADLSLSDSIRLQQEGLGPGRDMGCGLFIPHKSVEAVTGPG